MPKSAEKPQKDTSIRGYTQQSIRFASMHVAWLEQEARRKSTSFNSIVRELVEDASGLYGIPLNMRQALEKDAERLGLDRREYLKYLLGLRYEALVRGEVKAEPEQKGGTAKK